MIRIQLPDTEIEAPERALRTTADAKLRHRVQIVPMAHRGRPHPQIAADTGTSQRSVPRWLNAYLDGGLERLRPRRAKGASPELTEDLAPTLRPWVIDGPAGQGLDRAHWTYEGLAEPLFRTRGIRIRKPAMQVFCRKHDIRPYRPTYRFLRGDPEEQAQAREEPAELNKGAEAGELVLLSQDEARFPRVPTRCRALGVKGHRPTVGTRDCEHPVYVVAVVNVVTAALRANPLESPKDAAGKSSKSKVRRLQEAFAAHLRHVGRVDPRAEHQRVVLLIDNAPWHAGQVIKGALADHPHLELKRWPSDSPQLNVIERFWRRLRRRATHNRLFDTMADLKRSLRASLCYDQTVRGRIRSLVAGCYAPPAKQTASAGA